MYKFKLLTLLSTLPDFVSRLLNLLAADAVNVLSDAELAFNAFMLVCWDALDAFNDAVLAFNALIADVTEPPPIDASTASNLLSTDWENDVTFPIPVIVDALNSARTSKPPAIITFVLSVACDIIELDIWSSPTAIGNEPLVNPTSFPNVPVFLGPEISIAEL